LLPRIRKTLLLKRYGEKIVEAIAYDFRVGSEGVIHHLTGFEALYLKDKNEKWYGKLKQAYYLLVGREEAIAADYAREKEQFYQTEHFLDEDRHKRRYAGDVTWNARKREARRFIGLHKFLDVQTWYEPGDFKTLKSKAAKFAFNFWDAIAIDPTNPNLSATQFYEALVEQLGLEVEKSEWKTELVSDGQGKAVLNKDGTQKRKKYKLRRISADSWKWFEMFCDHRREMKERRVPQEDTTNDSVPTIPENVYEMRVGWNMAQSNTGHEIEGGFHGAKTETNLTPVFKTDESLTSTNTQTTERDDVPTTSQNLYKSEVGWNMTQSQTEQRIEGDLESQKMETNLAALAQLRSSQLDSSDEQQLSTTTQTTKSNDVPTTPENLYEIGVGWNMGLSQTEQRIEGDFSPGKNEANNLEIQGCLKQLRQVKTADDYWQLYERSSQLVEEAWKLLFAPEQLRIQQICDEGIDPLSRWKEGERVMLWHPFAQEKWGLATVKQVVRGACGFIYVLRDDGFGLHLGRDKLGLIAPI
jgi:hypothetical protein